MGTKEEGTAGDHKGPPFPTLPPSPLRVTGTPRGVPCELLDGLQVQDDLLDIRGSVRTATGIRIALIGPSGEIPG